MANGIIHQEKGAKQMAKLVNIRPTTSVYATYKNIKYDPWSAIAEFVDNSTQSYYDNESRLVETKYWDGLDVRITYERSAQGDKLIITDNAYGMNFYDFKRAITLDSPPKKPSRSQFGMGLKTAACWFGTMWSVESTELGSDVKYYTKVDVEALQKYKNEEITVEETPCKPKDHGTTITIWNLNRSMSYRQIGKTKDQLRGMYRSDLRTGKIHIYYNDVALQYEDPAILVEQLPDGSTKTWKKDIAFDVSCNGKTYPVNGFIALLDEGNVSGAGFTLMRCNRVIVGGYENCYRPEEIFEKSNSYVYQRLIGELNMDNWPVTQTKDGFDWYSGLEDLFIEKLLQECNEFKKKAKEYRKPKKITVLPTITTMVNNFANAGIISDAIVTEVESSVIQTLKENATPFEPNTVEDNEPEVEPDSTHTIIPDTNEIQIEGNNNQRLKFTCDNEEYIFNFVIKSDSPDAKWLSILLSTNGEYIIEWNIRHPFFKPYIDDPKFFVLMQQFTFALALSEIESKRTGIDGRISSSAIRTRMNETLKAVMKE